MTEQYKEVERAIIDRGKYQFRPQYRFLQVAENKWFKMNTQQGTKHVSKVQSLAIEDEHELSTESELTQRTMEPVHKQEAAPISTLLSVNVASAAKGLSIPLTCIQGVWKKAAELLHKPNSMVTAPGWCAEACMVLSYSGRVPRMVVP